MSAMVDSSSTALNNLPNLFRAGTHLVAVQSPITERRSLLEQFLSWTDAPLHFWSAGFKMLQQVEQHDNKLLLKPCGSDRIDDILQFVINHHFAGWFMVEGLLELDDTGELSAEQVAELTDTFYTLQQQPNLKIVLVDEYVQFPIELMALIPTLENPLPEGEGVNRLVSEFCIQHPDLAGEQRLLVRACLGLPHSEVQLVLSRLSVSCSSIVELAQSVLAHKVSKLKGRGLEFIAKPDVPAGGLDVLEAILDRDCSLLSPHAAQYELSLPKGILLWGPPGTGKSLSAKHAALKMGVPLIAANWGSLRSPKPGQSEKNLNFLLQQCCINAPVVLFFDDFEKGFAGWSSDVDGGVESRLANKLLTWMQERIEPVYVVATCNRLEKLPPELIRRFDTIVFVDLPHAGARKEIFDLHLAKYFPAFRDPTHSPLSDREWRRLLKATHLCTPAEIALIVRKAAQEAFYQSRPGHCTLEDLLVQRSLMVPAMIREEEAILAIRNRASFARPAASPDTSQWAMPEQRLFQFDSDAAAS